MSATATDRQRSAVQLCAFAKRDLRDELARLAQRNDRSVSAELRIAVRRHLEQQAGAERRDGSR
jgi:GTP cyclohydrolase FolE2